MKNKYVRLTNLSELKSALNENLSEEELQKNLSKEIDDRKLRAESDEDSIKTEQDEELPSEITPKMIIDQINTIRSGKSLDLKKIRLAFNTYLQRLSPAEEASLYINLRSLAQIMSAGARGAEVEEPSPTVDVEFGDEETVEDIKVVKKAVEKKPVTTSIVTVESYDSFLDTLISRL